MPISGIIPRVFSRAVFLAALCFPKTFGGRRSQEHKGAKVLEDYCRSKRYIAQERIEEDIMSQAMYDRKVRELQAAYKERLHREGEEKAENWYEQRMDALDKEFTSH